LNNILSESESPIEAELDCRVNPNQTNSIKGSTTIYNYSLPWINISTSSIYKP